MTFLQSWQKEQLKAGKNTGKCYHRPKAKLVYCVWLPG